MSVVTNLDDWRAAKLARSSSIGRSAPVELFFDLADPFSYLAAERVDRAFGAVVWTPAVGVGGSYRSPVADRSQLAAVRRRAEERAAELRMPLVWPERFPSRVPTAMRVASLAAEQGRAASFALAAGRLAFCGGFDLDDPEILAVAVASAGLSPEECLVAAGDLRRDEAPREAGRRLLDTGADGLPALRVGDVLFWGEERIPEAAAAARRAAV